MKTSLTFLTWNRLKFVQRAVINNIKTADYPIDEIIWVDNGSTDGTINWMEEFLAGYNHKKHLFKDNQGSAIGYNKAYSLVSGKWIARPSSDMCMPQGWLKLMMDYAETVSMTGIVAMVNRSSIPFVSARFFGGKMMINGKIIQPANALGSILFNKEIIDKGIFLPTEGKYGYDDTRWTMAVRDAGYNTYYIDGIVEDFPQEELRDYPEYVEWKSTELKKFELEHPEFKSLNCKING